LRLELVVAGEFSPHPALLEEPGNAGCYLFEQRDLAAVSTWLGSLREEGLLADFRIGPPTLDDIYAAAVLPPANLEAVS